MNESTGLLSSSTRKMDVPQQRNKNPARVYYVLSVIVFMVLFLDSVVSLGCFGTVQRDLHNFREQLESEHTQCILFGRLETRSDGSQGILLSRVGACALVLWGQVSIMILAFTWIVYYVAQAVIAPKVISVLRILDFIVLGLSFLFSFALSITVTAGLNKTCGVFTQIKPDSVCFKDAIVSHIDKNHQLYFYDRVHASQTSLWVAFMMFLFLTIWNGILVIIYLIRMKNRKKQALMARLHDEEDSQASNPSPEPEELGNVAEEKKPDPDSPFTQS